MELIGIQRARGRDLATGIVLGAGFGLAALFLYLGTTSGSTTGARVTIALSAVTIGAILSTALLVGPAATALQLTRRPGRAIVCAALVGIGAMWLGILLAYRQLRLATAPPRLARELLRRHGRPDRLHRLPDHSGASPDAPRLNCDVLRVRQPDRHQHPGRAGHLLTRLSPRNRTTRPAADATMSRLRSRSCSRSGSAHCFLASASNTPPRSTRPCSARSSASVPTNSDPRSRSPPSASPQSRSRSSSPVAVAWAAIALSYSDQLASRFLRGRVQRRQLRRRAHLGPRAPTPHPRRWSHS
jgi:ABC 3 transport family